MTRSKSLALVALTLLLVPTALLADRGFRDRGRGAGFGCDGDPVECFAERRAERMSRALDLSESQAAAFEKLRVEHRARVEPRLERMRTLGTELRQMLGEDSANAEAVGRKVLALRDLRREMRSDREQLEQSFEALLDPEQKIAWQAFERARPGRDEDGFFGGGFGEGRRFDDRRGGRRGF